MIGKSILIALGVVSGAAMMAISAPSYSEGTIMSSDELGPLSVQQDWATTENESIAAEGDADTIMGVAGRRADEMADEGPAGPGLGIEHRYASDTFVGE